MTTVNSIRVLLLGLLAFPVLAVPQNLAVGSKAPDFMLMSEDGKRHTLKDLEGEGTVFLFFVHDQDPVTTEAASYIHKIARSYVPSHSKWFGVYSGRAQGASSWATLNSAPYKMLVDDENRVAHMYKIESSPAIVEIDVKGNVVREWQGYSGYWLKDLNGFCAKANRMPKRNIDFSKTPSTTIFGTKY